MYISVYLPLPRHICWCWDLYWDSLLSVEMVRQISSVNFNTVRGQDESYCFLSFNWYMPRPKDLDDLEKIFTKKLYFVNYLRRKYLLRKNYEMSQNMESFYCHFHCFVWAYSSLEFSLTGVDWNYDTNHSTFRNDHKFIKCLL